jgi:hypothetical protein
MRPYAFAFTLKDPKSRDPDAVKVCDVPVMMAYEYVAVAHSKGPAVFEKTWVGAGGHELLEKYWANARQQPWGRLHPHLSPGTNFGKTLPIIFHYDGVAVHNASGDKTELGVLSVSSLSAKGCTYDIKFPLLCVPTHLHTPEFYNELAQFGSWQCRILASGKGASTGCYGEAFQTGTQRDRLRDKEFAAGWRGVFAGAFVCV